MNDDRQFVICLPFPPSLNILAGKRYPPKVWKETKERAAQVAFSLAEGKAFTGSMSVHYLYQKDDLRRYDIENCSKAICDGFTVGGLWVDDYQIDWSLCKRLPINRLIGRGVVYIHIRQIAEVSTYDIDHRADLASKAAKKRPKKH